MNSGDGKNRPDGELASAAGPSDAPSTFLTSEAAEPAPMVSALDESWRRSLGAVAKRSGFPSAEEPAKLEASLRQLSAAYNDREGGALAALGSKGLPARLAFSFPRDVPKSAAALREVLGTGLFSLPKERPLRILDLGAGLGATTWGVLRALAATGAQGRVEAVWVEPDEGARGVARALVQERRGREGALTLSVKEVPEGVEAALARVGQGFDLVLLGQVLSEMHRDMPNEARVAFHASLVERLLQHHLAPQGLLVVIEPALRDRTRHLHAVRRDLLAKKAGHVVAPCLQEGDCPALSHEHDWCHEDLPVHLPPWLVPLARGAGLRFEGLTFSYLVLSRGKRSIAQAVMARGPQGPQGAQGAQGLRVVSGNLRTKGKCELLLCGAWPSASPSQDAGSVSLGGRKVSLLDRDGADHNAPWAEAQRGDILMFDPPLAADGKRVPASTHVTRLDLSSRSFGEASTEASTNSTSLGTKERL